jgi:adenylate cyclase
MHEERAKRKLSGILSADAVGYSRLMQDDEAATILTLADSKELMADLIQEYRGRVVDAPGDNLLAEFASVVDAAECAVKIQQELQTKNVDLPDNRKMHFRMGVNLGDVVEKDDHIYGDGVNIAARLEGLAEPGGICISRTAYDHVKNKLELGYEYLGEHSVKNISEPVRVYRILTEPEDAGKMIEAKKPKASKRTYASLGALALIILVAGVLVIWNNYFRVQIEPVLLDKMAFPLPDKPSIAVLPFDNLSGDPEQEYLADGFSESIISALSKIPRIFVISRNSTFFYKGKPVKVQQISADLGVRYILEGSIQKSEDQIRITTQLIDAIKGHHLWANQYDRELKDLFALQDEITLKILTAVEVKLTEGDTAHYAGHATQNMDAYLKFMQGTDYLRRWNKDANAQARRLAKDAIALDPKYPAAYQLLGWTYYMDNHLGWSKSPGESLDLALEAAQKAIALNDLYAPAHGLMGTIYLKQRQYESAIAECERAIELQPNLANNHAYLSMAFHYIGRHVDAIAAAKKAIRHDPHPPTWFMISLGSSYYFMGKYDEAIEQFRNVLKRNPRDQITLTRLSAALIQLDRTQEAQAAIREVLKLNPSFSVEHIKKTWAYKNQEDLNKITAALRKAGLPEYPPLQLPEKPSIAVLPFENMSGDPKQEYFSDGITEQIITSISKIPAIFVIARTSSFAYKNKSIKVQQIAKELGVRYVLEGSIQRDKDLVRINVQLVDALSGKHIWAEDYDRKFEDIFAIQDEITIEIMAALQIKLTVGTHADLKYDGTKNLEAYEKLLKARYHIMRRTKEDVRLGQQFAKEAVDIDPNYAAAYRMMGLLYLDEVWFGMTKSPAKSIEKAEQMAQKAISLRGYQAPDYVLLSSINLLKKDFDEAIKYGEKAAELGPNNSQAHFFHGMALRYAGHYKRAIFKFEKAIRLNPIKPLPYLNNLGWAYLLAKEYESAIMVFNEAIQSNPDYLFAYMGLSATYNLSGNKEKSQWAAENVLRVNPQFSLAAYEKRSPIKIAEDKKRIINAMRDAGLK